MTDEQKFWIVAILTFLAGAISLATQMLDLTPDVIKYLAFAAALINLALAVFFGRSALKARKASKADD